VEEAVVDSGVVEVVELALEVAVQVEVDQAGLLLQEQP
jgi:hypothetical protein